MNTLNMSRKEIIIYTPRSYHHGIILISMNEIITMDRISFTYQQRNSNLATKHKLITYHKLSYKHDI